MGYSCEPEALHGQLCVHTSVNTARTSAVRYTGLGTSVPPAQMKFPSGSSYQKELPWTGSPESVKLATVSFVPEEMMRTIRASVLGC